MKKLTIWPADGVWHRTHRAPWRRPISQRVDFVARARKNETVRQHGRKKAPLLRMSGAMMADFAAGRLIRRRRREVEASLKKRCVIIDLVYHSTMTGRWRNPRILEEDEVVNARQLQKTPT